MAVALGVSSEEAEASRARTLRAVDLVLLAYLAVVSVVAAIRAPGKPECWWLLLGHALFVVLLIFLTKSRLGRVGRIVRELYPLFLLPALYRELDVLNLGVGTCTMRWCSGRSCFCSEARSAANGGKPYRADSWSTMLHAAYLSYYLILSAPALYFAWRGDLAAVRRFVLAVITTFVLCYLVFLFFPVAGPYYQFPRPAGWFIANLPARLAYDALATGSSYGTAFPRPPMWPPPWPPPWRLGGPLADWA